MKFNLASVAVVALATQGAVALFGSSAAYNKWHETELERWLSDHDIPFPTASDRKDLQNLVEKNWENNVAKPYNNWDTNQLQNYLSSKGQQAQKGAEKNKDSLLSQIQSYWHETSDQANEGMGDVKGWIFDTWTESQLKSFLDYHGIPNPTPRTRDSLLSTARSNYQSAANKVGETASYPGNWLYQSWSDSDIKSWLDERGIPAPQPGTRDKLIASMRRNARIAANQANSQAASASKSAAGATQSLSDQLLDSWSDSQIKEWCDKNGIKVPQGSKRNELVALARKNAAKLSGGDVSASGASAYGAATSSAGNFFAQATNNAYDGLRGYYDSFLNNFGLASADAKSSLSSASSVAAASASSASGRGGNSMNSAASVASASAASASNRAGNSVSSGSKSATSKASSAKNEL